MTSIGVLEQRAFNNLETLLDMYDSRIAGIYSGALIDVHGQMKRIYDKWAVSGKISMADMARYNRYSSMEKQIMEVADDAAKKAISEIKRIPPSMYNEAFLNHAWAIDNASGLRLNWGLPNKNAVAKLFSLEDPTNIHYAEALHNYPMDMRRRIRGALTNDLSVGKSFETMAKDLKHALTVTATKGMMIARTEGMTALNAGTDYSYIKAREKGVEGYTVWDSTFDGRTRPTHQVMDQAKKDGDIWIRTDGVRTPGPGGYPAPYPGFEGLPAQERIHCRCHERFEIEGYAPILRRAREKGVIPYQDYKSWKDGRVKTPAPVELKFDPKTMNLTLTDSLGAVVGDDTVEKFNKEYGLTFYNRNKELRHMFASGLSFEETNNGCYFSPSEKRVFLRRNSSPSTIAHELAHALDMGEMNISSLPDFEEALGKDLAKIREDFAKALNELGEKASKEGIANARSVWNGLDIRLEKNYATDIPNALLFAIESDREHAPSALEDMVGYFFYQGEIGPPKIDNHDVIGVALDFAHHGGEYWDIPIKKNLEVFAELVEDLGGDRKKNIYNITERLFENTSAIVKEKFLK